MNRCTDRTLRWIGFALLSGGGLLFANPASSQHQAVNGVPPRPAHVQTRRQPIGKRQDRAIHFCQNTDSQHSACRRYSTNPMPGRRPQEVAPVLSPGKHRACPFHFEFDVHDPHPGTHREPPCLNKARAEV